MEKTVCLRQAERKTVFGYGWPKSVEKVLVVLQCAGRKHYTTPDGAAILPPVAKIVVLSDQRHVARTSKGVSIVSGPWAFVLHVGSTESGIRVNKLHVTLHVALVFA